MTAADGYKLAQVLCSRINLSTFRVPLTVVLSKGFESKVVW